MTHEWRRLFLAVLLTFPVLGQASAVVARDGAHDFDFLIGDWKAHARQLPDRLNGSQIWISYDGVEHHSRILGSNANLEEFKVGSADKKLHLHAQTLRLYNSVTHQWSMYLTDVFAGSLDPVPIVGGFTGPRGEFFRQTSLKGRTILMRYVWLNISPKSARMEQSFSDDGGKTWELNWVCELSR
ncbi:MAG: hypothetical protein V4559_10515 [Pseudomonadota bacterium]